MKKSFGFITAIAALATVIASAGPVRAQYTVTGDLSIPGFASTYTGSLAGLFGDVTPGGEAVYINHGTPFLDMYANQDYIVATSSNGSIATFSEGEITLGGANLNIGYSSSTGYTVSSPQQSLST